MRFLVYIVIWILSGECHVWNITVPPKPENVSVEMKPIMLWKYDVTVSCAKPVFQRSSYSVWFITVNKEDDISGDKVEEKSVDVVS
jgi:hypothetical protein